MKRLVIYVLSALIFLSAITWLSGHGRLNVSIAKASGSGPVRYSFTDAAGKTTTFDSTASSVNKIIRSGNYQVLAARGEDSFLGIVHVRGLLRSAALSGELRREHARQFVGDNPGACMFMVAGTLVSGNCQESIQSFQAHLPADAQLPTYTAPLSGNSLFGNFKGTATLKDGSGVLLLQDIGESNGYYLAQITPGLSGGRPQAISGVDSTANYEINRYQDGFTVSDQSAKTVLYYQSFAAQPVKINIDKPNDTSLKPISLTVTSDAITVVAGTSDNTTTDPAAPRQGKGKSEVIVYKGGNQTHYSFTKNIVSAQPCGNARLCVINGDSLEVYGTASTPPRLLYTVPAVKGMQQAGGEFLVTTTKYIFSLNVDTGTGYAVYSFGGYGSCGLQPSGGDYIVCLTLGARRMALLINPAADDRDAIDKKVLGLQKTSGVDTVSAYGRFIYIVPDYGNLVYDPNLRINAYNPETVKKVNAVIDRALEDSNIDRSKYTIVNTGRLQ